MGVAQDARQVDALAEKLDVGAEAERGDLGGDAWPFGTFADEPQSGRARRAQARKDVDDVVNPFDRTKVRDVNDHWTLRATGPRRGRPVESDRRRRSWG